MKKHLLAAVLVAAGSTAAFAIPFDNTAGAAVTATVGTGGDYATLFAASQAFNAVVGGINRPWTLSVLNNLTEPANSGFANSFGAGASLTLKPASTTTPTIEFTNGVAPAGTAFFAHLVFGSYAIDAATGANTGPNTVPSLTNTIASSGNYIIDGSNTVGGTTKDMTIGIGIAAPFASPVSRLIRAVGATQNMVIKNVKLVNNDTAGVCPCVGLGAAVISATNLSPDGMTIQNSDLSSAQLAGTSVNGSCVDVVTNASGALPAGTAVQNLTVQDCNLTTSQRGIFMNGVGNATLQRNNITISNSAASTATAAIFHFTSNSATPYTQVIDRNVITVDSISNTAPNGGYGITIDNSGTLGAGTHTITNNVIKGAFLSSAAPTDSPVRGININDNTASTNTVEHNSISIPATSASAATANKVVGIYLVTALTTGSLAVNNNIVSVAEVDGLGAPALAFAATTGVTANNNDLFAAGPVLVRVAPTDYATLAAYQVGTGLGAGSQSVDPTTTTPAWDAALHFASKPITGLANVAASTTLADVDGDVRPATGAVPGADEPTVVSAVQSWTSY